MSSKNWPFIALIIIALFFVTYAIWGGETNTSSFGPVLSVDPSKNLQKFTFESPFAQFKRTKSTRVPILMYHYVEYNQDKRDYLRDSLNIQPHIFEQQVLTLKEAGYTFVTPEQLYTSKSVQIKKPVVLSFDDGYADFYTDVFPLLKKHNAKAVSYVVPNYIGKLNYMTAEQIAEINKSGLVEFGSHTMNHSWLPNAPVENVEFELIQSKKYLEDLLGQPVVSFAYPYGVYDATTKQLVEKAGYSNAVSTVMGISELEKEQFELKRLRPGYNTGEDLLFIVQQ